MADLDEDLFEGLPGREPSEAPWEAQADLEHALLTNSRVALMSLDFKKYFDSFDLRFTQELLRHYGFPPLLVNWWAAVYSKLGRIIKIDQSLGEPCRPYNGNGQGDPLSLIPCPQLGVVAFQNDRHDV